MVLPTQGDIGQSLRRLQLNFEGNYGLSPILEDGRAIGSITSDARRIYITFRGSVNSLWEVLTCLDIRKRSLEELGIPGKAHRGIYAAFTKIRQVVLAKLQELPAEREILVEGYSRGAGIATLMGADLKNHFPGRSISVLAYSPLKIFDRIGSYHYGEKVPFLYNFICKEDFVPRWAPSWLGFVATGRELIFSATHLSRYSQRVNQKTYLHLMGGCIGKIIKFFLPARIWEAHMPETYQEGAPCLSLIQL